MAQMSVVARTSLPTVSGTTTQSTLSTPATTSSSSSSSSMLEITTNQNSFTVTPQVTQQTSGTNSASSKMLRPTTAISSVLLSRALSVSGTLSGAAIAGIVISVCALVVCMLVIATIVAKRWRRANTAVRQNAHAGVDADKRQNDSSAAKARSAQPAYDEVPAEKSGSRYYATVVAAAESPYDEFVGADELAVMNLEMDAALKSSGGRNSVDAVGSASVFDAQPQPSLGTGEVLCNADNDFSEVMSMRV